jgi:hypothetical protein
MSRPTRPELIAAAVGFALLVVVLLVGLLLHLQP